MLKDRKLIQSEALDQLEENCVQSLSIAHLLSALGDSSSVVEPEALTCVAEAAMRNAVSCKQALQLLVTALEGHQSNQT
jgi:hypothetical protein